MRESESIIASGRTFVLSRATPEDADPILAILEDAARWLVARGIEQWHPGDFLRLPLQRIIARGEVYLARCASDPAGTLSLQWEDVPTWGVMPPDAAYIHGFAVHRAYGGLGLGRALLDWAARQAVEGGKSYLRLDCLASNPALRAYYERAGFSLRGLVDSDQSALYERHLINQPPAPLPS